MTLLRGTYTRISPRARSPSIAEAKHARTLLTHKLLQAPKVSFTRARLRSTNYIRLSFVNPSASEAQIDPSEARYSL